MLVEHRVDDCERRLLAIEQAVRPVRRLVLQASPGTGARSGRPIRTSRARWTLYWLDRLNQTRSVVEQVVQRFEGGLVRTIQAEGPCLGIKWLTSRRYPPMTPVASACGLRLMIRGGMRAI